MMRLTLTAFLLAAVAGSAYAAQPVALRAAISDEDGRVTLGELFDGAGRVSGVVVSTMKPGSSTVLDAGEVQRIALANGLGWNNPAGLRRIVVRPGAEAALSAPRGGVEVLAYARNIAAGETIGAEDLVWAKVVAEPRDAPRDAEALIGMAAKRPLRSGAAAGLRDVAAPLVIRKDEVISVSYSFGGVSLILQAKALQNASAGETVNVLNPTSKKTIQAVAASPGHAVVGPDAAQHRAAAAGRSAFASLR
jgi:flagella basal body P-ring formation protein FlgA